MSKYHFIGAISSAGGELLFAARKALPREEYVSAGGYRSYRRCKTGNAVITSGRFGKLKCNHVIHTVGPNYNDVDDWGLVRTSLLFLLLFLF